jgi:membrane protein
MAMKWIRSVWQFTLRVSKRFFADACSGRAAGLAFSSLFALVPLTAFVVAVLSAFGAFDPLIEEAQAALIQQLVPAVHEEVFAGVREFASNTRALGFFGLFIFLATAVLLLRNINLSFNAIWGFRTRRGTWGKIASYTSTIVIGTTLISVSFALGPIVQSVIEAALPDAVEAPWFRSYVLPPLFLFLAIFSLNILVPAGKVRPGSAALGAGVSVIIWELAKFVFVFWSTSVMRFNLIYGSLAVLPIFLIWLYLTWFVILVGVEVSYLFQHRGEKQIEEESNAVDGPVSSVLEHCVATALDITRRHRDGLQALNAEDLDYSLGAAMADRVRTSLAQSGLFLDTDHGVLPVRGVESISVEDLVSSVVEGVHQNSGSQAQDAAGAVSRLLALWREDPATTLTDQRVMEFTEELNGSEGQTQVDHAR